ncbi:nitroreductase family protein [Halobacillus sp. H74]|uniref:nitroreductase family protein n=1 Tax=Halobacillus sp. H74 TaxID=3457436 RepID=UPI003FCC7194
MDLLEAIINRRSIHEYKNEQIDRKVLKQIFSKACWAPNHRMKEPWSIKLYQGDGKMDYAKKVIDSYDREGFFNNYDHQKSNKMKEGIRQFLLNIPHHALVYMERDPDQRKYEEDYAAVCAYIQNVQLLAWEAGIGVLWTTSPYLHDNEFVRDIGLDSSDYKLVSVLQMGYPLRIPNPKKRTPIENKMQIIDSGETKKADA